MKGKAHEIIDWLKNYWLEIILTFFLWFGINAFAFWLLLIKLDVDFFDNFARGFLAGVTGLLLINMILEDYPE